MPTKESIKRELDFSKNMAEILDVMKQLAQSQFTAAKKVCVTSFNAHLVSFGPAFEAILSARGEQPFIRPMSPRIGVVVTTSDQAFMGALNSKIVRASKMVVEGTPKENVEYMVTGRKGARKFKFNGDAFTGFSAIKEGAPLKALARDMTDYIIDQVKKKRMGKVLVISAFSTSFSSLEIKSTQLLPFEEVVPKAKVQEIRMDKRQIILESKIDTIAEYTAQLWVYNSLYYLFQNNKPAEYGALAVQMEGSHDSVKKVIGKLNVAYKRARNDKIDANMREIFVSTMVAGG